MKTNENLFVIGDVHGHYDTLIQLVVKLSQDANNQETFREYALWNRKHPPQEMPIFNIFGHTPVEFGVETEKDYVNVDTGCYCNEYGYGELSAYFV